MSTTIFHTLWTGLTHANLAECYTWQWDGYHLQVEQRDGRDGIPWDHLQAIKNLVCDPDTLMVEFYPPENQVINDVNRRHLWAIGGTLTGLGNYHHP